MSTAPSRPALIARVLFIWGQSCAYWGNQTLSKRLYQWAVGSWTRALVYAPDWRPPLLRRAVIRGRELDDYAGAVRDLSELIERYPEWAEAYLQRGLLHSFHGLQAAPRAVQDLQHFLALAHDHSWQVEAEQLVQRLRAEIEERGWHEEEQA